MFEAKLLVGRILQFSRAPSVNMPIGGAAAQFVTVVCPPLTVQDSVPAETPGRFNPLAVGIARRSVATTGAVHPTKAHRNFKWLPWHCGDISETTLNYDVLTGPMSGCYLVTYDRNAVRMAGHIGTVGVTDALPATINTNVKATFTAYVNLHPAMAVHGFNPHNGPGVPHPAAAKSTDSAFEAWGLMTTTGQFYAIHVWIQKRPTDPAGIQALGTDTAYRVAGVYLVPSLTRAQLLLI